ncbi:MAG: 2OG-Fe(II) oxygenase [Acidobacteriota bacterium]
MGQPISIEEAIARAKAGDAEAQYALSAALHQAGKLDESLDWLRLAASRGLVPARLALAALLMDGQGCPRDLQQAGDLLRPLAASHVQANLLLAELHGFAALRVGDRETGLRHLLAAARMGDAGARRQLALLAACHRRSDLVATAGVDWRALEAALPQLAGDLPLPAAETLHGSPLVRRLPAVLPPVVLDALIELAAPLVRRSEVVDARTGETRADPMRTSSHVTFAPRQHDHVLEAIEQGIARISGLPALNGEFVQILRYRIGEEFRPHVDYFNETGEAAYRSLADGGQRAQTVLLYLSDDYAGGTTAFPKLGLDIRGRRGDVLHFHNLDADGVGHRDTLHAGTPVTGGEKWLLSKWIRSEPYPPRLAW